LGPRLLALWLVDARLQCSPVRGGLPVHFRHVFTSRCLFSFFPLSSPSPNPILFVVVVSVIRQYKDISHWATEFWLGVWSLSPCVKLTSLSPLFVTTFPKSPFIHGNRVCQQLLLSVPSQDPLVRVFVRLAWFFYSGDALWRVSCASMEVAAFTPGVGVIASFPFSSLNVPFGVVSWSDAAAHYTVYSTPPCFFSLSPSFVGDLEHSFRPRGQPSSIPFFSRSNK